MSTFKKICIFCFSCFIVVFAVQCKKEKKKPQLQSSWKADNPQTIPFRLRDQLYKTGNLVENPSFEEGKIFFLDSINTAFNLPGWQKVGSNVFWVKQDTASSINRDEVNTQMHAIKISREDLSFHNSSAEGIQSDYIKLIPGHYTLSFYVKLKGVRSFYKNHGNLKDVLDIRIEYFDRNKIELVTCYYDASAIPSYTNKKSTNAAFSCINDFNWGKVILDSHSKQAKGNIIPDDARYAKIFLGFRGKGNVWFDDVSLRLTKHNFTYLERITPSFDSNFTPYNLLIPQPKTLTQRAPYDIFPEKDGVRMTPAIVIPYNAPKHTRAAANMLKEKIEALYPEKPKGPQQTIPVLHNINKDKLDDYSLIFSVGKTTLFKQNTDNLPFNKIKNKNDGYIIFKPADINIIYLTGNNPTGNMYAVATISQLLDPQEKLYHHADIIDYPDFHKRPCVFSLRENDTVQLNYNISNAKFMMTHKFNFAYLDAPVNYNNILANPDKRFYKERQMLLKNLKKYGISSTGITIALPLEAMNNISINYNNNHLLYSLPEDELRKINNLKKQLQQVISPGVKEINLIPEKFDYSLVLPKNPDSINCTLTKEYNQLAYTHAILANHIYHWLNRNYPQVRLNFCTPWFCNKLIELSQGKGEAYFNTLMPCMNKNITLLWTGSESITCSMDDASIEEYKRITSTEPVLMNNLAPENIFDISTPGDLSYQQKAVSFNIIRSYDVDFPSNFHQNNTNPELIVNTNLYGELDKIKYMTIADYLWNRSEYNADLSLYKSLVKLYGKSKTRELIQFNNHYYNANMLCDNIKHKQLAALYAKIPNHINNLNESFNKIYTLFEKNTTIIKELEAKKQELINALNTLKEKQMMDNNTNNDSTN
jgi:hypothetical protein